MDRLEAASIRLKRTAGRHCNDQVHLSHKIDMVPCVGSRWQHSQLSRLRVDRYIHKAVERTGNAILRDPVRRDRIGDVPKAALMGFFVAVDDAKCVLRARCKEEVMPATGILDNLEHDIAAVGVQWVASSEVDPARIVQRSAVGYHLVVIVAIEGDQIGHLDSFGINDRQALSFVQNKRRTRSRRDFCDTSHGARRELES